MWIISTIDVTAAAAAAASRTVEQEQRTGRRNVVGVFIVIIIILAGVCVYPLWGGCYYNSMRILPPASDGSVVLSPAEHQLLLVVVYGVWMMLFGDVKKWRPTTT